MPSVPQRAPLDYDLLASNLAALAYPLRLELLDVLERPHALSEIEVRPRKPASGSPERAAAMQTVAGHLERLVEVGLVVKGETDTAGKRLTTYTVNPQQLYALTEEIRRLSVKHSGRGRGADVTGTLEGGSPAPPVRGPRVVLVHGAYEGRAYPLDASATTGDAWLIGRARGLAVSLDYDPFVSLENSAITRRGRAFTLTDLPESKNGTSVNWEPMPRGSTRDLQHGDVIGVGRSLLNFYEA